MTTVLRIAERSIAVTLAADGTVAALDGAPHAVSAPVRGPATAAAGGWTVVELAFEVEGRPVRAVVARRPDRVLVAVHGRVFAFAVGDDVRAGAAHAGSGIVVAPMPGKVGRVLVSAGDAVAVGQPLVVLEAMKMETTLQAEIAGQVAAVHVADGAMVEGGATLVEIAPAS